MAHREFVDGAQVHWQVWDVHPSGGARGARVPASYVSGWLAFESESERRRLVPIPDGWTSLPDTALERLCAQAVPVPARRSTAR